MDDESDISLSSDSIIHKQWVVPKRMVLYLQAPEENARKADPAALKLIWRAQAVLVQAHIFECLDFLDIDVSSSPSCDIRGTTYLKPCLLMERIPEETTTPSDPEQLEIEVETVIEEIICEHLYKYYIFTHQVEKRELRIARPVISGVPAPSTPDDSEWVVQPLNSNKLVRSLRGRRKQAHFVRHKLCNTTVKLLVLFFIVLARLCSASYLLAFTNRSFPSSHIRWGKLLTNWPTPLRAQGKTILGRCGSPPIW